MDEIGNELDFQTESIGTKNYDYYKKIFNDEDIDGADYTSLETDLDSGIISQSDYNRKTKKLDRAADAMVEVADIMDYMNDTSKLKSPLDASDRAKAEIAYRMDKIDLSDTARHYDIVKRVVQYGGIVPKYLRRQLEGVMINGSIDQQISASKLLHNMQEANPYSRSDRNLSDALWQKADTINMLASSGSGDMEQMKTKMSELLDPIDKATSTKYREIANKELRTKNVSEHVSDLLGGDIKDPKVEAEYADVYKKVYRGDADAANQIAEKVIKSKFKKSAFSPTAMSISPESIAESYGITDPEKFVREDIDKSLAPFGLKLDLKASDGIFNSFFGDGKQSAFLVEDRHTAKGAGFLIKKINKETGMAEFLLDEDGDPLRYEVPKPNEAPKVVGEVVAAPKALPDPVELQKAKEARAAPQSTSIISNIANALGIGS